MHEEIARLSEELARDPSSSAFMRLGEILRQQGDLDSALKVTLRGLERHTLDAEAHSLLARICIDRNDLQRAFDEWDMALRLAPRNAGALKGLGFVCYRWGRLDDAEKYLAEAHLITPDDASLAGALGMVRQARGAEVARSIGGGDPVSGQVTSGEIRPTEASRGSAVDSEPAVSIDPTDLFRKALGSERHQALLLDADGLVLAGSFIDPAGEDRSQDVGANLSGVSDEADRAMRHLDMGAWQSITFESSEAVVAMSQAGDDAIVLLAAPAAAPLGLLRRVLERSQRVAGSWLEQMR